MSDVHSKIFEEAFEYPDSEFKDRLDNLIGIDHHKNQLTKLLSLLIDPEALSIWVNKYHPNAKKTLGKILRRPPLIILEGDVGSGKTELASTIGDRVARENNIGITLLPLSLSSRGQGRVGEMTTLISEAFNYTIERAKRLSSESGKSRGGIILFIDEADALAQSRENAQMHHEDKAGVNAFIRGIDRIGNERLPAAVIMSTNRISTLDPAIKRRAAEVFSFTRPNPTQREAVLKDALTKIGFSPKEIEEVVDLTGPTKERKYGFTFSDIVQRLIPKIVLDAFPEKAIVPKEAIEMIKNLKPTPPFKDE